MKRVVAIAALGVAALTARRHLTMRNALKSVSADLRSPFLKFYTPLVNAQTLPLLRAAFRLRMRPGAGVRVAERHLLGEPAVRVLVATSSEGEVSRPALLWIHSGGFIMGSPQVELPIIGRLARELGAVVVSPDYRLAPEHPFPAAIDDVLTAWRWLRTDQDLSASSIAVAGNSAGGGLAAALLVATRDAGQPLPAAAVLMSPTVDLTSAGASMTERVDQDPISTPEMLRQFASSYLAGADPKTPLASPLFASLAGLPPLLVQVGTADLLLSDSERLATAAAKAGVDVVMQVGEGLPHVYQLLLGTPEAVQATEQIGQFLRARVR
jgi:monoterpene epsilon-lactone hydrolase